MLIFNFASVKVYCSNVHISFNKFKHILKLAIMEFNSFNILNHFPGLKLLHVSDSGQFVS